MKKSATPNAVKSVEITLKKGNISVESFGKITTTEEAARFVRQFYFDDIELYESFFLALLNNAGRPIAWAKISQGGTVGTVVDPILVAKYAVDSLAKKVILVHNHPSGNLTPSNEDKELTRNINGGLRMFGIRVVDHIILSATDYYSFSENGLI